MTANEYLRQAQLLFDSANFRRSFERAVSGLGEFPEDASLTLLSGQCALELGLDDAQVRLQKAVNLAPDNAAGWHALGLCLLEAGDLQGALTALRESVRLEPADSGALVDLGHTLYAAGEAEEAIAVLADAVKSRPDDLETYRSLIELYRRSDRLDAALELASAICERWPADVAAILDAADLHLSLGHLDEAVSEFGRLRRLDSVPEHETYAYHGMIQAEIQRKQWRRALDLSIDAAAIDRYDVTTQLLAFVATQLFGRSERPAPAWNELEATLAAEREDHRRAHVAALVG